MEMSDTPGTETEPEVVIPSKDDGKPPVTPTDELVKTDNGADPPSSTKSGVEPEQRFIPPPILPGDFPEIDKLLNQEGGRYSLDKYTFNGEPVEMPSIARVGLSESQLQEWYIPPNTADKGRAVLGCSRSPRMGPFGTETRTRQDTFDPGTLVYFQNPTQNYFKDVGWIFPGPPNTIEKTVCQRVLFIHEPGSSKLDPRAMSVVWIPMCWLYQFNTQPRCLLWPRKKSRFNNGWDLGDFKDAGVGHKAFVVKGRPYVFRGMFLDEFAVWGDACKWSGELLVPFGHSSLWYMNDLDVKNNNLKQQLKPLNAKLVIIEDERQKQERESLLATSEAARLMAARTQTQLDPRVVNRMEQEQELLDDETNARERQKLDLKQQETESANPKSPSAVPSEGDKASDSTEQPKAEEVVKEGNPEEKTEPEISTQGTSHAKEVEKPKDTTVIEKSGPQNHTPPRAAADQDLQPGEMGKTSPLLTSPKVWSTNPGKQKLYADAYSKLQSRYPGQNINEKTFLTEIIRLSNQTEASSKDEFSSIAKDLRQLSLFFNTEVRKFFQKADNAEEVMFEKLQSMTDLNILTQSEFVRLGEIHAMLEQLLGNKIDVDVKLSTSRFVDLPQAATYYPDRIRRNIPHPAAATLKARVTPVPVEKPPSSAATGAQDTDDDEILVEYSNIKPPDNVTSKPKIVESTGSTALSHSPGSINSELRSKETAAVTTNGENGDDDQLRKIEASNKQNLGVDDANKMEPIPDERPLGEESDELNDKRWEMERSKNPLAVFLADPEGAYFGYKIKNDHVPIRQEARYAPKGNWGEIGWETHIWFREGYVGYRTLQAGSARSLPIMEKEDLAAIFWITWQDMDLDWFNLKLGVKGSTAFFNSVKKEMVRTQGTMEGVTVRTLLPEGKRSRASEADDIDRRIQQQLHSAPKTSSRPSTPLLVPVVSRPSTPLTQTPIVKATPKRKSEKDESSVNSEPPVKRMTREASMPPFTKKVPAENFGNFSTIYDPVKKEFADAFSDCETKARYKKSFLKGILHVLHVAFDAIVEKKLLENTEIGQLDYKTLRCSLNTCHKEMNGLKNDYIAGMVAMRKYPFILIACDKWRTWLATSHVMNEETYFNLIVEVLKTSILTCKNWMNYNEQRVICRVLGKSVSKGMNLGDIRKELCEKHNIEGREVFCEKQQQNITIYPTYDEFLDILTNRAQQAQAKQEEKLKGPQSLSLSQILGNAGEELDDESGNESGEGD